MTSITTIKLTSHGRLNQRHNGNSCENPEAMAVEQHFLCDFGFCLSSFVWFDCLPFLNFVRRETLGSDSDLVACLLCWRQLSLVMSDLLLVEGANP